MNQDLIIGGLGVVLCLFGFSLYWGGMRLVGFFVGGTIGALVGLLIAYIGNFERLLTLAVIGVAGLIGAALGWRLVRTLHRVVIFLLGAGAGFLVGEYLLPAQGLTEPWVPLVSTVAGGLLAVLLLRYIIILVTSAIGAYLLFQATGEQVWVLAFALVLGVMIQIGLFHGLKLDRKVRTK